MEQEQPKYTTIIHKIRIGLELSCNEYCVADIIFCLSSNPGSKVQGWCYASKETIGNFMGISKQSAHNIINNLIAKGLVEKDEETKYLRTTQFWYDKVVIERMKGGSKESLPIANKVDSYSKESLLQDSKESLLQDSKESLHNNNKQDNNKITTTNVVGKPKASYGNPEINQVIDFLKAKLGGSLDGPIQQNRNFASLLIKRFQKDYPNGSPANLAEKLIEFALKDSFHSKNATNFKYLYYHAQSIIQSARTEFNNPKYVKIT